MAVLTARRPRQLLLLSVVSITLVGCGGGGSHSTTTAVRTTTPAYSPPAKDYSNYYPPGTHKASAAQTRVITRWSNELRAGHVRRAAAYFALPVIVQNATPPLRLTSRRQVLEWNRTLPCGAHVVKIIAGAQYAVATFVLTERPGSPSGCGSTGRLAATAFLIRHDKIVEWRRVLVPPPLGPKQNLKNSVPDAAS